MNEHFHRVNTEKQKTILLVKLVLSSKQLALWNQTGSPSMCQ